jgi:mycofactocin precursor
MNRDDENQKEMPNSEQPETEKDAIFHTEEIVIEELAIDGICGVY